MRRTLILGGIALVLVLAIGFFAFVFTGSNENGSDETSSGFFGSLFPFNFGEGNTESNTSFTGGDQSENIRPVPMFRKISDTPTAGGMFFENEDGSVSIRYIERATGHVFQIPAESFTSERISNTTIPEVQEIVWAGSDAFIIRYLNEDLEIENFYAELQTGEESQPLVGNFIDSWDRGALDPQNETLFTVTETANGSTWEVSDVDGANQRLVFSSSVRSWIPVQSESSFYVQSAPAPGVDGFLYQLSGGNLLRVLGDIPGFLVNMSDDGEHVLGSNGGVDAVSLSLFDLNTGEEFESPLNTLSSKCVFIGGGSTEIICGVPKELPKGEYPNDWLLGRVSFTDDIWVIDPVQGSAALIATPLTDVGEAIDVWQPHIDESGSYFGFINKKDLSYWVLRLREAEVPLEGGALEEN